MSDAAKNILFLGGPTTFTKYKVINYQGPRYLYEGLKRYGGNYGLKVSTACSNLYANPACLYDPHELTPRLFEIEDLRRSFNSHPIFTMEDLYHIQNADVYCIHTTFGAKHKERVYNPKDITYKSTKTAVKEMLNNYIVDFARLYNKKLIVLETGTLSRIRSNYTSEVTPYLNHYPRYERVSLNHWNYDKGKWCKADSLKKVDKLIEYCAKEPGIYKPLVNIYDHAWKNNSNGFIMIVGGYDGDPSHSYESVHDFIRSVHKAVRAYSDRKIVFRPHPYTYEHHKTLLAELGIGIINPMLGLRDIASQCYCAVIDNSTSVFELINLGIPCVCTPSSFAYPLGNADLNSIESLHYADSGQVLDWYKDMSFTEFSTDELYSEDIGRYIRELIDD
jgi:hypothetical protein